MKDHFDGFWKMHSNLFPKSYQADIQETVEKAIKFGTSDLGYARYECLGCEGEPIRLSFALLVKAVFVISVERSIRTIWQINNRK